MSVPAVPVVIERRVEYRTNVERSRFHALLFPAASQEELDAVLRQQRTEHRRANHHCWACRIVGADAKLIERSKDDGEVGHPGRVLLGILRDRNLLGGLAVSRVFGGVKLGVGGVSRAFRDAGIGAADGYRDVSGGARQS